MCSKMAAKLINSSDESSMGSAVYFSRRVFTENLKQKHREKEELTQDNAVERKKSTSLLRIYEGFELSAGCVLHKPLNCSRVLYPSRQMCYCI